MSSRLLRKAILCGLSLSLLTCGSPRPANYLEKDPLILAEKVLATAWSMIGRPYKYRGENPAGFDCSGLVRYSYLAAGMDVPHGTGELKQLTHYVREGEMRKGDLVFFERDGKNVLHVGIYAGDNRFVHAPRPGKAVRIDSLLDPYWKERFIDARRF